MNNIHENTTNNTKNKKSDSIKKNTTNNTKNKKNTTNNTKNNISGPIKEKLKEIFKSSIYQKEFYENNLSDNAKNFKTKFKYLFDENNSTSVSSTTSKKKPTKTTSSVENVSPKESLNIKKLVKTNPINNENPMLNKRVNFFKTNFRKEYYKNNREKFEEMLNFIQLDEKKNIITKVYIFDIMNLFNNKSVVKNQQNKKSIIRKARDEPIRFYLNFLKNETEKTSIIDSNLYIKVFPSEISDNTFKIIKIQKNVWEIYTPCFKKKKNGGYTACSRKIKQSQENNSSKTINGNNSVTISSISVSSTTNPKKKSENNSSNKNIYTKNPNDDYMCLLLYEYFYLSLRYEKIDDTSARQMVKIITEDKFRDWEGGIYKQMNP